MRFSLFAFLIVLLLAVTLAQARVSFDRRERDRMEIAGRARRTGPASCLPLSTPAPR